MERLTVSFLCFWLDSSRDRRGAAHVADIWPRCAPRSRRQSSKLAMDSRRAPTRIFPCHATDQSAKLRAIFDLPPHGRDFHLQNRRNPARCQRTTISGFTMTSTSDHRGQTCGKMVQNKRSKQFSAGRVRFRLKTATCCRRARTSSARSARQRKNMRTAARNAPMTSKTIQPL